MKQLTSKNLAVKITLFFTSLVLFLLAFVLFCSFKTQHFADDFLKQLGISKTTADQKITGGLLGGHLDIYGVKNAKNILIGNRKTVVLDLLSYSKKYASSEAFIKQYNEMKETYKPKPSVAQTPEEIKAENIARAKQFVADAEGWLKKADPGMKATFEKSLLDAKKNLATAQDPNNPQYVRYAKNYEGLVKTFKEDYDRQMANWTSKYPSNHLLYIKKNLQQFMEVTKDIDYDAELTTKNGKKYFANPDYERMDRRRKMAFRAGKEAVEPAREFVQKWIDEIQ